ncbi:oxidoreductase [Sphingomonas sp. RS6]
MIRTGLIGFGLGGTAFHAPLIEAVPGLELSAVATSRVDAVKAAYPSARVADADALIADQSIDVIVLSTPNATHYPLARAALMAGKHVVVDKPFAQTPDEAAELIALAKQRERVICPFHNRRWDSDFLTVQRVVQDDTLGEVMLFEAHWDRFRPERSQAWKESVDAGGGQLPDLGSHMIDQALVLFGPPDAIAADLAVQREGTEIEDYFALTLHYGRRRVVLASSRLVAAPRPRFSIHGMNGSFVKFGLDPQEAAMRAGGSVDDPGHGIEAPEWHGRFTRADGHSTTIASARGDYRRFYAQFAAAIRGDGAPPVDAADALAGLRIIDCARRSARDGRLVPFSP